MHPHETQALLALRGATIGHLENAPLCREVDLAIYPGEVHRLEGPSGCGKSTLLRSLVRLTPLLAGSMFLKGQDASAIPPPQLRRQVLLVGQTPVLEPGTVRQAMEAPLAYGVHACASSSLQGAALLRESLDRLGLQDVPLDAPAGDCSVGQQQRLCLLRALHCDPNVLLLDEPFAPLDAKAAALVEASLVAWVAASSYASPRAALVVSHQAWGEASGVIQSWQMDGGRLQPATSDRR